MLEYNKTNFIDKLAAIVIAISFIFYGAILYFYIQHKGLGESNYLSQILTAVISMDTLVLAYYFGSSKSSANKDATIKSLQDNVVNPNSGDVTINTDKVTSDTIKTDNIDTVNTQNVTSE